MSAGCELVSFSAGCCDLDIEQSINLANTQPYPRLPMLIHLRIMDITYIRRVMRLQQLSQMMPDCLPHQRRRNVDSYSGTTKTTSGAYRRGCMWRCGDAHFSCSVTERGQVYRRAERRTRSLVLRYGKIYQNCFKFLSSTVLIGFKSQIVHQVAIYGIILQLNKIFRDEPYISIPGLRYLNHLQFTP